MTDKEKKTLERLKEKEAKEKKEAAKRSRIFKDMCKQKFGLTPTEIADKILTDSDKESDNKKWLDFGLWIAKTYGLENEDDIKKWKSVVANDNGLAYWQNNRYVNRQSVAPRTDAYTPS